MYYKDILTMKKIVSLRLDEEVLKNLDERMKEFRYWKKHAVMCAIIENVLLGADPWDLSTIVHHRRNSSETLIIRATEEATAKKP